MKKILLSTGIVIFMTGSLALGGTGAFFSDTETSSENTFTAGAIDLKIDNTSYYNGVLNEDTTWSLTDLTDHLFFDFDDLKPGDIGEDTISIHVDNNDAYVCADITLTSNEENGFTEPEALVDQTSAAGEGELAQDVNFIWWADDGDNVLEDNEEVISEGPIGNLPINEPFAVALADSDNNIWTGQTGPIAGNETKYIGKGWCFGNLSLNKVAQDGAPVYDDENDTIPNNGPDKRGAGFVCDGSSLNNSTQTDSLTADIKFSAVQSRHNPDFLCIPERPPVITACTLPDQKWADSFQDVSQGARKNGTAILPERSSPSAVLGVAQSLGADSESPVFGSFFSLGFATSTQTRSIVVSFDNNIIIDGEGADVKIYEITGGSYPDEHVKVEASKDGVNWVVIATDAIRDEEIDLNGLLDWVKYIRMTDINLPGPFESTADGYDLDAVEALNCGVFTEN